MTFEAQNSSASQTLTVSTICEDITVATEKCFVTSRMLCFDWPFSPIFFVLILQTPAHGDASSECTPSVVHREGNRRQKTGNRWNSMTNGPRSTGVVLDVVPIALNNRPRALSVKI